MTQDKTIDTQRITYYGCVACQRNHRQHLDPLFDAHWYFQSKHGYQSRPSTDAEEKALEFLKEMTKD